MSAFWSNESIAFLQSFRYLARDDYGLNWGDFSHLHWWTPHAISFSFMMGATPFSNPEDHRFRFGLDELCPTIEEFVVLLCQDTSLPLANFIVHERRSPRALLAEFLGLWESQCQTMIVDDQIHLDQLIHFFLRLPSYTLPLHYRTSCMYYVCFCTYVTGGWGCFYYEPPFSLCCYGGYAWSSDCTPLFWWRYWQVRFFCSWWDGCAER